MNKEKPSATAALILKVVLVAATDELYPHLVAPDSAQLSQTMAKDILKYPGIFLFLIKNKCIRWLIRISEKLLNKGFILHVAARKKYIEKLALEAVDKGCTQVIVIGAGYDTLGLRMAKNASHLTCLEVDHPITQKSMQSSLSNTSLPPNFYFIPADLSLLSISEVLQNQTLFDASKKTLIIIEGVLMYLTENNVNTLLTELITLFPKDLHLIFTFMDKRSDGDITFVSASPLINWWLRRKQENFLWGIAKNDITKKMNDIGFSCVSVIGKEDFIAEYFHNQSPEPVLAEGEMICHVSI